MIGIENRLGGLLIKGVLMFTASFRYDQGCDNTLNQTTGIKINHICAACGWIFGEHFSVNEQRCPTRVPTYENSVSKSTQAFEHRFFKYYQRLSISKEI